MNEIESNEGNKNIYFSIQIENIVYDLFIDPDQGDKALPLGQATLLGEDGEEISEFDIKVEEIIVKIVRFFGYKGKVSKKGISYFVEENAKGKNEMNFFGEFGFLKIDEKGNLEYETTPRS